MYSGVGRTDCPLTPVDGYDRLKHCSSLPDLIGRHLLVECSGRHELGHVPVAAGVDEAPDFVNARLSSGCW